MNNLTIIFGNCHIKKKVLVYIKMSSEFEILEKITKENAPKLYSFDQQERYCKVIDVYDGDTINIVFLVHNELQHHKFRIYGIDTPEIKPLKKIENRQEVVTQAKEAKEYLKSLILDKIVYIKFMKEEKYGRKMGKVYLTKESDKSVGDLLIEKGHAKEYFGGKK